MKLFNYIILIMAMFAFNASFAMDPLSSGLIEKVRDYKKMVRDGRNDVALDLLRYIDTHFDQAVVTFPAVRDYLATVGLFPENQVDAKPVEILKAFKALIQEKIDALQAVLGGTGAPPPQKPPSQTPGKPISTPTTPAQEQAALDAVRKELNKENKNYSEILEIIEGKKGEVNTRSINDVLKSSAALNTFIRKNVNNTILMMAAARGEARLVGLLLAAGANPKIKDANGKDALFFAKQKNAPDVISLLETALTSGPQGQVPPTTPPKVQVPPTQQQEPQQEIPQAPGQEIPSAPGQEIPPAPGEGEGFVPPPPPGGPEEKDFKSEIQGELKDLQEKMDKLAKEVPAFDDVRKLIDAKVLEIISALNKMSEEELKKPQEQKKIKDRVANLVIFKDAAKKLQELKNNLDQIPSADFKKFDKAYFKSFRKDKTDIKGVTVYFYDKIEPVFFTTKGGISLFEKVKAALEDMIKTLATKPENVVRAKQRNIETAVNTIIAFYNWLSKPKVSAGSVGTANFGKLDDLGILQAIATAETGASEINKAITLYYSTAKAGGAVPGQQAPGQAAGGGAIVDAATLTGILYKLPLTATIDERLEVLEGRTAGQSTKDRFAALGEVGGKDVSKLIDELNSLSTVFERAEDDKEKKQITERANNVTTIINLAIADLNFVMINQDGLSPARAKNLATIRGKLDNYIDSIGKPGFVVADIDKNLTDIMSYLNAINALQNLNVIFPKSDTKEQKEAAEKAAKAVLPTAQGLNLPQDVLGFRTKHENLLARLDTNLTDADAINDVNGIIPCISFIREMASRDVSKKGFLVAGYKKLGCSAKSR